MVIVIGSLTPSKAEVELLGWIYNKCCALTKEDDRFHNRDHSEMTLF